MNPPVPVIDLFAGAGGLSEGFSRWNQDGIHPFEVKLSIERNRAAIRTLKLRAFYHQFRQTEVPEIYYDYLRGEAEIAAIANLCPAEWQEAEQRCIPADLAELPTKDLSQLVSNATAGNEDWILIGGPPCRPYSTIGRARDRERKGYNSAAEPELNLYQEYRKVVSNHWPAVFVLENVRGLLSASCQGQRIFPKLLEQLRNPPGRSGNSRQRYRLYPLTVNGKDKSEDSRFLLKAEDYGIPQARHRVIILGVREDISEAPEPLTPRNRISSRQILEGLPPARSGLSRKDGPEEWLHAVKEITSQSWWADIPPPLRERIQTCLNELCIPEAGRGSSSLETSAAGDILENWFLDHRLRGTIQHHTRSHRKDDLWRYLYAACAVQTAGRPFRLKDFPEGLRPGHRNLEASISNNHFADRFCVVPEHGPSRTVMSHIRKDGHYYIHYDPTQCRSLTVREAARLQTFPDNYFFEGNRTEQYEQIGNAVPPYLSFQIAQRVAELLERRRNG